MKNFDSSLIYSLYKHNWSQNYGDDSNKETLGFWNESAEEFAVKAHCKPGRELVNGFLSRFEWSETETVIDVASGPGTYSIPLSKKVAHLTAIDFSENMLYHLKKQAEAECALNISTICARWLEISDLEPADTVLCLNCLGVIATDQNRESQIISALKKLRDCTKKRLIVLIPHADSVLPPTLKQVLGQDEASLEQRRIAILYLAMADCDMMPDLTIIRKPLIWQFNSLNDACETLLAKAGIEECKNKPRFENALSKLLYNGPDGRLCLASTTSKALYTWLR